jgi:hypothetical protein
MDYNDINHAEGSGCFLPFVSFLVFYTLHDMAVSDLMPSWHGGPRWVPLVIASAPLFCLGAWLIVFHAPIGNRLGLAPLRAIRRISAPARHLVLWVALICAVIFVHYLSAR